MRGGLEVVPALSHKQYDTGSTPVPATMIQDLYKRRAYARQWMARRRAEYFKDKKCAKCSSIHNLELDHIDPTSKVSHKIWSWSKERREIELVKCQVLCEKCHKKKTITYIKIIASPCGTHNRYANGCRCSKCKKAQREYMRQYRVCV